MQITTSEYQTANLFSMTDDRMKERIKKIRFSMQNITEYYIAFRILQCEFFCRRLNLALQSFCRR